MAGVLSARYSTYRVPFVKGIIGTNRVHDPALNCPKGKNMSLIFRCSAAVILLFLPLPPNQKNL